MAGGQALAEAMENKDNLVKLELDGKIFSYLICLFASILDFRITTI